MHKIVINVCYGGFTLSKKATERLAELGVESAKGYLNSNPYFDFHPSESELPRHDSRLVQVVEELGKEAYGRHAKLKIEELSGNMYRNRRVRWL